MGGLSARALAESLLAQSVLDAPDLAELRIGVEAVAAALEIQPGLTSAGEARAVGLCEDSVRRLNLITTDRRAHPEIADVRVSPPLFILGMPRCGTSLMHA